MLSYTETICNKILKYSSGFPVGKLFSIRAVSKQLTIDEAELEAALTMMSNKYVYKTKGYFQISQTGLLFWKDGGYREAENSPNKDQTPPFNNTDIRSSTTGETEGITQSNINAKSNSNWASRTRQYISTNPLMSAIVAGLVVALIIWLLS
jgi:hypothetical protein